MRKDKFINDAIKTESHINIQDASIRFNMNYGLSLSRLLHASMGMITEAAEFQDALKKPIFYGKVVDVTNLKEELGDILWYVALAMHELDTNFEVEMARVIYKLKVRYPDKFTEDKAINRDLVAERKVLEDQPDANLDKMLAAQEPKEHSQRNDLT